MKKEVAKGNKKEKELIQKKIKRKHIFVRFTWFWQSEW